MSEAGFREHIFYKFAGAAVDYVAPGMLVARVCLLARDTALVVSATTKRLFQV